MRKLWIVFVIIAIVIIGAVFIITHTEKEPDVLTIGAILPLTSDGAKYGQSAKKGIDLAVEEINALGGIRNRTLRIIYEDSMLDPKQAVSAINKLITVNKVPAIIGAMASSVTLAIAPIAEQNHIVLLSPASSAPDISKAGDYIFRNTYSDIYEGPIISRYAYEKLGFRRIAILHIDNDFGVGLSSAFRQSFVQLGGTILAVERYEQGSSDFRSQLRKIKQSSPEAIYLVGYSEMGAILRQAKEMALVTQVLSCIMFEDPTIVEIAQNAAEGVIYAYPAYDPHSNQQNVADFVQRFKDKYNEEPNIYAASSYDALKILAHAIDIKGFTPVLIKEALYSIHHFPGVTGSTTFDKHGDVIKPIGIKQLHNGKFIWLELEF